ncbi:metallothiol transferase FosB-like [Salvia splendens]|uniref:metallothiol transferase FosB-like n=1 Tax=Salvia splendens TaxID=180675 RepID=UPI001100E2D2|nr:metallothiol transferase FosB-like [Salvia splendens]
MSRSALPFGGEAMMRKGELPLLSLNHVSYVCKSVQKSVEFYVKVLGFVLIQRPSSFKFEGAWLFNHGIGIHLLKSDNVKNNKEKINPKDNHISFQCTDMNIIIERLEGMKIEYVKAVVREGGIIVDQIFFHDPDGHMIEICNCQDLPVLPLTACPVRKMSTPKIPISKTLSFYGGKKQCSGEVEAMMIENLAMDMMNISI